MNGSSAKRGSHGLRRRCPVCKKLRKFCEPPGDVGGEDHPRRKPWKVLVLWGNGFVPTPPAVERHIYVCGWCVARRTTTASRAAEDPAVSA